MKYPKEYLDEIKLRLKVSQVVGKTVQLKKRGKEFVGLSPFKNEKSPSFGNTVLISVGENYSEAPLSLKSRNNLCTCMRRDSDFNESSNQRPYFDFAC